MNNISEKSQFHRFFPHTRLRRTRQSAWIREMVAETTLHPSNLVLPIFLIEGEGKNEAIPSLPGVERMSIDIAIKQLIKAHQLGIGLVAIFPVVPSAKKNPEGSEALNPNNLVCRALKAFKQAVPAMGIMTDVALDPYTSHGHDGIMSDGQIINDETVAILCEQALLQAKAGADIVAPSDMMDGRIAMIRQQLEQSQLHNTLILSYAVKYASHFYGPFRDAVQSGSLLKGDKKTYQMDYRNTAEALHEAALDVAEGADMLMVKPGLPYLDVLYRVKQQFALPTLVYQVSGEYAMLKAAAAQNWLNYEQTLMESLLAFRRAGADAIITYAAIEAAEILART
ncbi:MAG: porphobilinogen synthase [Alphaproteobacteria bacterium]